MDELTKNKKIRYDVFSVIYWIITTKVKNFLYESRVCNAQNITEAVDLGKQPLANKYPKNKLEILKEKKFNLKIMFCKNVSSQKKK